MHIPGLVSIITPCYNSSAYVHRLLDSVLMQDYPFIEMFAIDDGSMDNTREIIESYITRFENRGYSLTYVHQENAGQAAAVNRGLKYVKGEYLTWPDSDDYYNRKDSISTFVNEITQLNSTYGVVCNIGTFVDEKTLQDQHREWDFNKRENLFETCLLGGDFLAIPINYMIRMEAFDKVNPERNIYIKQQAQNMQMLLPLFYSYKCKTFYESLSNIVVLSSSHSRHSRSYNNQKEVIQGWLDIKLNTLDKIKEMNNEEREKYKMLCLIKDLRSKLELAFNYKNRLGAQECIRRLKEIGVKVEVKKQAKAILLYFPWFYNLVMYFK